MDYVKYKNIEADTAMRESLSKQTPGNKSKKDKDDKIS
jgi:uncharacterized protein YqfA (UPF0365 family)